MCLIYSQGSSPSGHTSPNSDLLCFFITRLSQKPHTNHSVISGSLIGKSMLTRVDYSISPSTRESAPNRTWTCKLSVMSWWLYQLSYRHVYTLLTSSKHCCSILSSKNLLNLRNVSWLNCKFLTFSCNESAHIFRLPCHRHFYYSSALEDWSEWEELNSHNLLRKLSTIDIHSEMGTCPVMASY